MCKIIASDKKVFGLDAFKITVKLHRIVTTADRPLK